MANIKIIFVFLFLTSLFHAQNKAITHNDYDLWKKITDVKISHKGKLIVSTIETATKRGDGYVEIYDTQSKQNLTFFNGYDTSISYDENYVVFKKRPEYELVRREKKKKIKKKDQTKDVLFIYDVRNNLILDSIPRVKRYKLPKGYEGWIVIENFKNKTEVKKKATPKKELLTLVSRQNYALVYNLKTKKKDTIHQIKDFIISEKGESLYYSTTSKIQKEKEERREENGEERDIGIYHYDLISGTRKVIDTGHYLYSKLSVNKEGDKLAYVSVKDSTSIDSLQYELYYHYNNKLEKLISSYGSNLRKDWILSGDQTPFFSENGNRLYFYSKPKVGHKKDTALLEDEIPQVDVWNWKDKLIQPEQKSKFEELHQKAYLSYFDIEKKVYVHLQDKDIDDLIFDKNKNQQFILGAKRSPYEVKRSWDYPRTRDFYSIDTNTGDKQLSLVNTALEPFLSPNGKYALYFDIDVQHWFSVHLETLQKINLTKEVQVAFYDEENDRPMSPYPYGFGGFDTKGNALIYDKFDIWRVVLNGKEKPKNITRKGRKNSIEYRTEKLDVENKNNASYSNGELLITSFNKLTKVSGLYTLRRDRLIEKIKPTDFFIEDYKKAKITDVFTYSLQNFSTSPDIYVTTNNFNDSNKITAINSHQENFKWGTTELFSWKTYDGKKLEGIIYKPVDFDSSKKYPMITFFYEKKSDNLNRYSIPGPSRSTVNPTYLVSNDYIMFVPDIVYEEGKPGPSAYNCIVSGVEAVEKLGYIDHDNIAIQGQSWGGYQVAYLITKTNKFKAAMAGAPVSNMTSAYGGIRWKSGLSRAFQYEKTQSRIGKNLWEGFDLYIENSPLFGIPNIETPLLIMHNDKDGAVPYYQGIEMFMGMRRLQKPVWLLVYNDEAHNLKKVKNKQDLSIRMMQFFDHYLKDKPAPEWMSKGVPRTQKGKDFGYGTDKE